LEKQLATDITTAGMMMMMMMMMMDDDDTMQFLFTSVLS
jgi:hypothetical protein